MSGIAAAQLARQTQKSERVKRFCKMKMQPSGGKHEILDLISLFARQISVLDIGANTGSTSLPAYFCMKPKHRIVAVEQEKQKYDVMVNNREIMDTESGDRRFVAAHMAFEVTAGMHDVFISGKPSDNATRNQAASSLTFKDGLHGKKVQFFRGDEYITKNGLSPDVIKIDVQGTELRVLKGMHRFLRMNRDIVILAANDSKLLGKKGFGRADVYDYMKGLGFKVFCKPFGKVVGGRWVTGSVVYSRDQVLTESCPDLTFWKVRT